MNGLLRAAGLARSMFGLVFALAFALACASTPPETVDRPLPPHPHAETAKGPILGSTRTERGVRSGAVAFRSEIEFDAPNRFREVIRFDGIDQAVETRWDGERFTRVVHEGAGGSIVLGGDEARAVFDRALEEALLTRQYESEPSLVVHALPELAEFHGAAASAYEVSHGPSGFARILFFDPADGRLLGWTGRRWKPNGGAPVEYEVRFLAHGDFDGRQFPTRYEAYEEGVLTVEATIESASLRASAVGSAPPETGSPPSNR